MGNEKRGKPNHLRENEIRLQKKIEAARKRKEEIEARKNNNKDNIRSQKRVQSSISKKPTQDNTKPYPKVLANSLVKRGKGKRVFIIAGGESVKDLDLYLLHDEDTIVVNRAFFSVPNPTYFISMDNTFSSKITPQELTEIKKSKAIKVFVANFASGNLVEDGNWIRDKRFNMVYDLHFYDSIIKATGKDKLSHNLQNFYTAENSGFCALQLAIALEYSEIYLCGIDLRAQKETHFHGGYGENLTAFNGKLNKYFRKWNSALLSYNGTSKIYSLSPNSPLNKTRGVTRAIFDNVLFGNQPKEEYEAPKSSGLQDLIVVGYYTKKTPYEIEAKKTIASCNKLGLNHDFKGIDNLGNWQANTRYKAKFMLEMLDKHKDKNLLYVDCDAIIRQRPILFENYNCDISVRYQDFRWRKNECLSGTIYMENNKKTRKLCELWLDRNVAEGEGATSFEQWNLGTVIQTMIKRDGLKFKNLPPEYTFIFDHMKTMYPGLKPVIEHFQASRKFRNQI